MSVEPFTIQTDEAVLADLRQRLRRTRWTDQLPGDGWEHGTELGYLQELCEYWAEGFDWRAAEARLNAWPNFRTTVDGTNVHLIHARSPHPGAVPLLLLHGWPGSVVEFLDVIGPLTDPPAHGGDAADAFHVVCPSLPGYAWSGPTTERGWDIRRVADAMVEVMTALGYDRFAVHGGDWGSIAACQLGAHHADRLLGIHITLPMIPPSAERDGSELTEEEIAGLVRSAEFVQRGSGYSAVQGTRPQTLAVGLHDSPAGLAAWIVDKFRAWTDCGGDVERAVGRDALLANITAYWVTGTIHSSMRLYFESMRDGQFPVPEVPVTTPTAVALFPKEIVALPRRWVEPHYNVVRWTTFPRGGHFAALEQPELLVDDIRAFYRGFS